MAGAAGGGRRGLREAGRGLREDAALTWSGQRRGLAQGSGRPLAALGELREPAGTWPSLRKLRPAWGEAPYSHRAPEDRKAQPLPWSSREPRRPVASELVHAWRPGDSVSLNLIFTVVSK